MRSTYATTIGVAVVVGLLGCRSNKESGEASQKVLVRHAPAQARPEFDSGDRHPDRIEVVVTDPRGGAAIGPSPLSRLVGQTVKVQFRRDLLGQSAAAPIPPTGQGPGGRAVSVMGILRTVSGGWLTVERDKTTYWIPQASILLIEQTDGATTTPAVE